MFKAIHNTEHGQFLALPNKEGGDNKEFVSDPCTTRSINAVRQETLQFPQLQKLLFSATLTQNPRKIASLKLVNPKYFTATTEFIYKIPSLRARSPTNWGQGRQAEKDLAPRVPE
jgi:hypothetical protein